MSLDRVSGSVTIDNVNSVLVLSASSIAKTTKAIYSGKYYWEVTVNSQKGSTFLLLGVANPEYTYFNNYSYFKYAYMVQIFHFWNSSISNGGTIKVNMSKHSFKYNIPVGYSPYDSTRSLVFHEGAFKTYSSSWTVVSTERPTISQFVDNGMKSVERISASLDKVYIYESPESISRNKKYAVIKDIAIEVK